MGGDDNIGNNHRPVQLPSGPTELRNAIVSIAQQADIQLVFADDLVEGIHLSCEGLVLDVHEATERVLAGTSIKANWTSPRRLILRDSSSSVFGFNGRVLDRVTGTPISAAEIRVAGTYRMTRSNGKGEFALHRLENGSQSIRVRAPGYRELALKVDSIDEGGAVLLDAKPQLIERMVVSAESERLNERHLGDSYIIRPNRMVVASGGDDLFDLLRTLPGVSPNKLGESGVSFRGSEPAENLVLLDGIKLYQMDHALGYYSAINADVIDEVRIFKAGYPAVYGERMSGVLDILTSSRRPQRAEGSVGVDRDMAKLRFAFPMGEHADAWFSVRRTIDSTTTDLIYGRVFERTFNEEPQDFEQYEGVFANQTYDFNDFIGKISLYDNRRLRATLTAFQGRDESAEAIGFEEPTPFTVYAKQGNWGNRGASLRVTGSLREDLDISMTASWSEYFSDFANSEVVFRDDNRDGIDDRYEVRHVKLDNRMDERQVALALNWRASDWLRLDAGLDVNSIDTEYYEVEPDDAFDWLAKTRQEGAYLQATWHPSQTFHAMLGARFLDNELTDSHVVEPRLMLVASPIDTLSLRAGYGRYHQHLLRTPDTLNYFSGIKTWFLAQDSIVPGESEHRLLGLRWERPELLVDLEAYRRVSEGHITKLFDPSRPDGGAYQTAGNAEGLDLLIERPLGAHRLQLAYAYLKTRVTENISWGVPLDHPTDTDRPHTVKLLGEAHLGSWSTIGSWTYASGLPFGVPTVGVRIDENRQRHFFLNAPLEPNAMRLDDNHQLDLSLRYRFAVSTVQGEVGVSATNVYDAENVIYRYYVLERRDAVPVAVPVDVRGLGTTIQVHLRLNF